MIVNVNGIDLFYEKTGTGRPLMMVHGNGEDHSIFDEAVEILKDRFTCYCVDSRGHGQSSPVNEYHYTDMARDMLAFMKQLNLRNAAFYGYSDGGIVALLAASKTRRITSLVTSGANLTPQGVKLSLWLSMRLQNLIHPHPLTQLMIREPHISKNLLRRIQAKTLVLAGENDLIREKETRRIARGIPGAEMRILPGEDHGSYIAHSPKIGKILLEYLDEGHTAFIN